MSIRLRAMSEHDLDSAWALSQQMKWPHRREDWQQALRLGAGLVAEAQDAVIGTALYWRWGKDYAMLGLVMVDSAQQGRGIGKALLQASLAQLAGYTVRLHATEAGKGLYQTLGFMITGSTRQHQCRELPLLPAIPLLPGQRLRPATSADVSLLIELDHQAHGQYRPQLIDDMVHNAIEVSVLSGEGDVPEGFAGLYRFGHGYVIGPVIARNQQQAQGLISHLFSGLSGQFVRIDSDAAQGLTPWLTACGLAVVDTPTTMVKGTPWQPPTSGMRGFGLMTQALG